MSSTSPSLTIPPADAALWHGSTQVLALKHLSISFRKTVGLVLVLLCCPTTASAINCERAKTAPEVAICSNPALKAFDNYLSDAYATIRSTVPTDVFAEVRRSQIQWIKRRDA